MEVTTTYTQVGTIKITKLLLYLLHRCLYILDSEWSEKSIGFTIIFFIFISENNVSLIKKSQT